MSNIRILYCAYGKAGYLVLNLLIEKFGVSPIDLICFTYSDEENKQLLETLQKTKIKYMTGSLKKEDSRRYVADFSPDLIVSMHYRDIIPGSILQMAKLGGFNLHPSLLPKYRGCFSAPWVIINGESKTGITYHYMDEIFKSWLKLMDFFGAKDGIDGFGVPFLRSKNGMYTISALIFVLFIAS